MKSFYRPNWHPILNREFMWQRKSLERLNHNAKNDNVAGHCSLYLSLFGEDIKAGEGRRTQMRMVIGDYGSDPEKHKELYQSFLNEVKLKPQSFSINPEIK